MLTPAPEHDASDGARRLPFADGVGCELDRVHDRLGALLHSPDPQIDEALVYLGRQRGKLLRPTLLLLSVRCVGEIDAEAIDLAVMVELVHRASLLHDDVIDAADRRRNHPTANALWGNTAAVLLGDFLLSQAFSLGARLRCTAAAEVLGAAAEQLCSGELIQNFQKGRWDMSPACYEQIIRAKTAALFESSCQLGALAASAPAADASALAQFGLHCGMAYQMSDDLLDLLAVPDRAAKTAGTDLKQGKMTLALIHWLGAAPSQRDQRIRMVQEPSQAQAVIEQMRADGSIDFALAAVRGRIAAAQDSLAGLAPTPAKEALAAMADYIADRLQSF